MKRQIERKIRWMAVALLVAGGVAGCGSLDGDPPPAPVEPVDEGSDDSSEGERLEPTEVVFPFEPGEESDEHDEPNWHEDRRCAPKCFKALWCHDGESDAFGNCIDQCEDESYRDVVDDRPWQCLENAETCDEIAECEAGLEVCDQLCEVYEQCEYATSRSECRSWCAGRFWAGKVSGEVRDCAADVADEDRCPDLFDCGLGNPGSDSE